MKYLESANVVVTVTKNEFPLHFFLVLWGCGIVFKLLLVSGRLCGLAFHSDNVDLEFVLNCSCRDL